MSQNKCHKTVWLWTEDNTEQDPAQIPVLVFLIFANDINWRRITKGSIFSVIKCGRL